MTTPTVARRERLESIVVDLGALSLDGACTLDELLPELRSLLGADLFGIYSVREYATGWQLDRCQLHGTPGVGDGMKHLFARRDVPVVYYDLTAPAPQERNRVVEATSHLDRTQAGGWRGCALYREVMNPLGLGEHRHHRMLLCEGPSLLAWFGALCDRELTGLERRAMRATARTMHRRLWLERLLEASPRTTAVLGAALDHIGAAAFVLGANSAIMIANAAARQMLDAGQRDTQRELREALAGRPSSPSFAIMEIRARGVPACWLAIASTSSETQVELAVARATARWQLTRRQAQVVALVVRGLSNAAIAAELSLSIRATELHVTALLDRAGVDNRAALVAAVLVR